jgi:hypothetical protein
MDSFVRCLTQEEVVLMEDAIITMTTTLAPLAESEAALAHAAAAEMGAQVAYQEGKQRMNQARATVRQLVLQERLARTLPEAVRLRQERRALEQAHQALEADLASLDRLRRQANTALLDARAQYSVVQEQASAAWRGLRQAQIERQAADSARGALDAQEAVDAAVDALAQVVGADEAERCAQSTDTPSWVRG